MKSHALSLLAFAGLGFIGCFVYADDAVIPGGGFSASHYETLWSKSPFSVASAEPGSDTTDYKLVGTAQLGGVSYASLIETQNQAHFILSSDKPVKGLTLVSVTPGHGATSAMAVVQKNGESLTLKLEQSAALVSGGNPGGPGGGPGAPGTIPFPGNAMPMPGSQAAGQYPVNSPPMPGAMGAPGIIPGGQGRSAIPMPPGARFRSRMIMVPPRPNPQQQQGQQQQQNAPPP